MADWTDIPDENLLPGRPARSIDAIALRDNVTAQAEGATGAPKSQTNSYGNETITAEKFARYSGTSNVLCLEVGSAVGSTGDGNFSDKVFIINPGDYRLTATIVQSGGARFSIYLNGSVIYTNEQASSGTRSREHGFTAEQGDYVQVYVDAFSGTTANVNNVRLYAPSMALLNGTF